MTRLPDDEADVFRFTAEIDIPMRLSRICPLTRLIRHAVYTDDFPPTHEDLWVLHADVQRALRSNRADWIYNEILEVSRDGGTVGVRVDMRNTQFIGADTAVPCFRRGYEPEILCVLDHFVPDDGMLVDVGCNWGYFPVHLALRPGFRGRVCCFEPASVPFNDLAQLVEALGLEDVIQCFHCGLGTGPGAANLSYEICTGNAVVTDEKEALEQVSMETLDSFSLPPADVLKVDVEGMEDDVIRGGRNYILACKPAIVFENWRVEDRARVLAPFEALEECGYEFYSLALSAPAGPTDGSTVTWEWTASRFSPQARFDLDERVNLLAVHPEKTSTLASRRNRTRSDGEFIA